MGAKAERGAATRTALLIAARKLFADKGFTGTSTEAILVETGMTRGALYHHFADKKALFAAVCEDLHAEAERVLLADANAAANSWQAVVDGCLAFVDFMVRPDVRRILILDAPGVLGWAAWNDMDRRHGFGQLIEGIEEAVAEGSLSGDPDNLAVMINGALNYAVVWAGQSGEPRAVPRLKAGFVRLMESLRT